MDAHAIDHPPVVTRLYQRPFTSQVWRCDVLINSCFLKNRVNFVKFRIQPKFQNYNSLVLNINEAARQRQQVSRPNPVFSYSAARLVTKGYFPARYRDACIAFSYMWTGEGRKRVHIVQQNKDEKCIYHAESPAGNRHELGEWKNLELQLDLQHGDALFFIEFDFDLHSQHSNRYDNSDLGYIAMRNFSIGYGLCSRNSAFECDAPNWTNKS